MGTAGKKYQSLLDSIARQDISPKHIYVVLPEGYALPPERLGNEEFVYTAKGMWNQRVFGMYYAADESHQPSEFQLHCDDDISFEPDFIARLAQIAKDTQADVLWPMNQNERHLSLASNLRNAFLGHRLENARHPYRITITATAGFIANTKCPNNVMPAQSGNFQCFLLRASCLPQIQPYEEVWLDRAPYALPDDQVFFYKCFVKGLRVFNCASPKIVHLDHGSSDPARMRKGAFAGGRNFLIFWHRFLYSRANSWKRKSFLRLAITYRIVNHCIYYALTGTVRRNYGQLKGYVQGVSDGRRFLRSADYRQLNKV